MSSYLNEIIRAVHHELRSPVNAIISMTDFAVRSDEPDCVSKCMHEFRKRGKGLLSLIDSIIDFAELDAEKELVGKVRSFSVCELLYRIEGMLRHYGTMGTTSEVIISELPHISREYIVGPAADIEKCLGLLIPFFIGLKEMAKLLVTIQLNDVQQESAELAFLFSMDFEQLGENIYELFCKKNGMGVHYTDNVDKSRAISMALARLVTEKVKGRFRCVCLEGGRIECKVIFPVELINRVVPSCRKDSYAKIAGYKHPGAVIVQRQCQLAGIMGRVEAVKGIRATEFYRDALDDSNCSLTVMTWDFIVSSCGVSTPEEIKDLFSGRLPLVVTDVPPLALMGSNAGCSTHFFIMQGGDFTAAEQAIRMAVGNGKGDNPLVYENMISSDREPPSDRDGLDGIRPGIKVLMVEDDRINQKVALNMLKELGCSTIVASSGRAAMKALNRMSFDIIFMDLVLPDAHGISLTRDIRQLPGTKDIPVIALTGSRSMYDECMENGMDDFMTKPLERKFLKQMILKWQGNNEKRC